MKRLSTGVLAVLMAAGLGLNAVAAPVARVAWQHWNQRDRADGVGAPPANFGSPPSGQIPILYNDHHVYTKARRPQAGPRARRARRGGTLLIPLRSMFEQMGATVSYDAGSKTATVSKAGCRGQSDRR